MRRGRRRPDGTGQSPRNRAQGVTDVVDHTTDLSKEKVALKDRLFRSAASTSSGRIVPWHSHDNRRR